LLQTQLWSITTSFIKNLQHDRDFRTHTHNIINSIQVFNKLQKLLQHRQHYMENEVPLLIWLYLHHLKDDFFTAISILTRLS